MAVNRAFSVRSFFLLLSLIIVICEADGRSIGKFWHVTDFHYDHTYGSTGLSCNEQVNMNGYYGDYWCDSPWTLIETSVNNMKAMEAYPDFILWTGDSVAHIKDRYLNLQINLEILQNITDILTTAFPSTPVYASLGNHDFYPTNEAQEYDEFFSNVSEIWSHWLSPQVYKPNVMEPFKKGGYYYKDITETIRLFCLNTNFYYSKNPLTENITDPAGQYEWLKKSLTVTRSLGLKAIISGHVTPGLLAPDLVQWMYPKHRQKFIEILLEFSDVIVATHFGHDHSDSFKLLQNENGSKAVTQFVAPSVTPWRYKTGDRSGDPHNPGIRLVSFDRETGDHLDYVQYYINLTDSNINRRANWTKLYSFTEAYEVQNMSVGSVREIYSRMSKLGNPYAKKQCQYALVGDAPKNCPDEYQAAIYCSGVHLWLEDAKRCKEHMVTNGGNGNNVMVMHNTKRSIYLAFIVSIVWSVFL